MGRQSRRKRERAGQRIAAGAAPAAESVPTASPELRLGLPIAIAILSFLPFLPAATTNGFVDWDDEVNFLWNTDYRGLGWDNLKWMWNDYKGHYMPFTWMTLGMDYALWGMDARGYHLTSMVLHSVNAVLFYLVVLGLLHRAAGSDPPVSGTKLRWAAAMGALLFALHPLRVESVAWATERRDVLSGLFFLLTLLAYFRYREEMQDREVKGPTLWLPLGASLILSVAMAGGWWVVIFPGLLFMTATVIVGFLAFPERSAGWLALTTLMFTGSLLSKAMGMALPLVLLAVDLYPLRRRLSPKLLLEKAPLMLLMGAAVLMTRLTQAQAKALYKPGDYKLADMITQPGYRTCFYVWKTLIPVDLSPLYLFRPRTDANALPLWIFLATGFVAAAVTIGVWLLRRRWPAGLASWFCYGVLIGPVIGLIQAGPHFAADRYTYLACMPFAVLGGAGVLWLARRGKGRAAMAVPLAAATLLGILSWRQTRIWEDTWTLWNHAMKIDDKMFIAYSSRGRARIDRIMQGKTDRGTMKDAIEDFNKGIALYENYAEAYTNRGIAHHHLGMYDQAIADHTRAIELKQKTGSETYAQAYNNRGVGYAARGKPGDRERALADYTTAIEQNAGYVEAYTNRTAVLSSLGRHREAIADCSSALKLNPDYPEAYSNRGIAYMALGELDKATRDFNRAIQLRPAYADPYSNRAIVKVKRKDFDGAIADFQKALALGGPLWPHRARVERMLANARRDKARATGTPR